MKSLFLEIGYRDIDKQNTFGGHFLYVSKIYSRFLSRMKIDNLRKITILIVNSPLEEQIIPPNRLTLVCVTYVYYDLDIFYKEDTFYNKCKIILDLLLITLKKLAERFNWPQEHFIEAYNKCIETEFKNEYELIKPKISKDRKNFASVFVRGNLEYISIVIVIRNCDTNESMESEILKVVYYLDDFSEIVDKIRWDTNQSVIVSNKNGEINFRISLIAPITIQMFFEPKKKDIDYLKDQIKLLSPEVSVEKKTAIHNERIKKLMNG